MKFMFKKSEVISELTKVVNASTTKSSMEILSGIKINAAANGLLLIGSDLDFTVETFIPNKKDELEIVEVQKTGSIVIQGKLFLDIIKKLPEDEVNMEISKDLKTLVKSGKSKFNLNGLDAEEYPKAFEIEDKRFIVVNSKHLKTFIEQTVFAVSTSQTRPILTGVKFKKNTDTLNIVATDSHRLAMVTEWIIAEDEMPEVVIPAKHLVEISKMLPEDEEVKIIFMENQIVFKFKNTTIFTRLLEGSYPDVSRLIPSGCTTRCEVDKKELYQAIDRASLLSEDNRNNVVQLTLTNGITISSSSNQIGKINEELAASIEGEELKISCNSLYIKNALKAIGEPTVTVEFNGSMKPFIIKGKDAGEGNFQLILPVRTY